MAGAAHGQIVMDGKLGAAVALNGPAFQITPDLGRQMGANLFHSFSQFNLSQGQSATFSGPANVQNILARVTGGSASSIDGTLRSTITGANLYLLNPSGIVFGPNATLDVSGSFVASTADYFKLADGGRFDARNPDSSVLTAAPVEKFGFLGNNPPGRITVDGSQLSVSAGQRFALVGGDIEIQNGARVTASGGTVNLTSVGAGVSEVTSAPELGDLPQGGTIALTGFSTVGAFGDGEGLVTIRAGALTISSFSILASSYSTDGLGIDIRVAGALTLVSASISSSTFGSGKAGDITIRAGTVEISNGSEVSSSTFGSGRGGDVRVNAGALIVAGTSSGISTSTLASQVFSGDAGDIRLAISGGLIEVAGGASVSSTSANSSRAGDIALTTGALTLTGFSRISSSGNLSANGNGGNITIAAPGGAIQLLSGASISSAISASSRGGAINVTAGSLKLDGGSTISSRATGDAPSITLEVPGGLIEVLGGSSVSADTFGAGSGGPIFVRAGTLTVDGSASRISSQTATSGGAAGDAGSITLTEPGGRIQILNGASISTATSGRGRGGAISVSAGSLKMDGGSTISSSSTVPGTTDGSAPVSFDAGNITLAVASGLIELLGGSSVSADTSGTGLGGSIVVTAGAVTLDGLSSRISSLSSAYGANSGNAGSLTLTVPGGLIRVLNGAFITADSQGSGRAGNITVNADSLLLDETSGAGRGSTARVSSNSIGIGGGDAGTLTLALTGRLDLLHGTRVSSHSSTSLSGLAGDITVSARSITLDSSELSADTSGVGNAGQITLTTEALNLLNGGRISAATTSSANAGAIVVTADSVNIDGGVARSRTGIASDSKLGASGNAGTVTLQVSGLLRGENGASLSASAFGTGAVGTVTVSANSIEFAVLRGNASLDGTLGPAGALPYDLDPAYRFTTADYRIGAELGRQIDGNLFHSFSQLNLVNGERITFSGPAEVQNILARVTGGSASSIDGILRSTIAGANLYLLNPNGILFGPNAVLDVSGSFVASTADYFKLADGGRFDARNPETSVLTAAPVEKFGFQAATPGRITVDGSRLRVNGEQVLTLVGGDIEIKNDVSIRGGQIVLTSIASQAEVEASPELTGTIQGGTITVTGNTGFPGVESFGEAGGRVIVRAGNLSLNRAYFSASTDAGSGVAGIDIQVAGAIQMSNASIYGSIYGTGQLDAINIAAGSLRLEASSTVNGSSSFLDLLTPSLAGNIRLALAGSLEVLGGSSIASNPYGAGSGGNIRVAARDVTVDGNGSQISSQSNLGASGNAGSITIAADTIQLRNQGFISTSTSGSGNSGSITLNAGSLSLSGGALISASTSGSGDGGDITITAGSVILDGSDGRRTRIATDTSGSGGGTVSDLTVQLDIEHTFDRDLIISLLSPRGREVVLANRAGGDGDGFQNTTFSSSATTPLSSGSAPFTGTFAPAGDLRAFNGEPINGQWTLRIQDAATADTGRLTRWGLGSSVPQFFSADVPKDILDHTTVESTLVVNAGTGNFGGGGNLTLRAGSLTLRGAAELSAQTRNSASGGAVTIYASGLVQLLDGALISSATSGSGTAGAIYVAAGGIRVAGGSMISSSSTGDFALVSGDAGGVTLDLASGSLEVLSGSTISSDTRGNGDAGSVTVTARSMKLDGASSISSRSSGIPTAITGSGDAGNITLGIRNGLEVLGGSSIVTDTAGPGTGGIITVAVGALTVDGSRSRISSSTGNSGGQTGDAGSVSITATRGLVQVLNGASISSDTAGTGNGGNVTISAAAILLDTSVNTNPFERSSAQISSSSSARSSAGNAGTVTLTVTGPLELRHGSRIASTTSTSGHAGSVSIDTGSLRMNDTSVISSSNSSQSIFSPFDDFSLVLGNAGNVRLSAPTGVVEVLGGSSISSDTFRSGAGGAITVTAGTLTVAGPSSRISSQSGSSSGGTGFGSGNAGSITIEVGGGAIQVLNGASIASDTYGAGHAGNIAITAATLLLDEAPDSERGFSVARVSSDSRGLGASGNAGALTLNLTDRLDVRRGTGISSSSAGSGRAGGISLSAAAATLDTGFISSFSSQNLDRTEAITLTLRGALEVLNGGGISSDTSGASRAGDIAITAGSILVNGGRLSSQSSFGASGDAGKITLNTHPITGTIGLKNQGIISTATSGSGKGGDIIVSTGSLSLSSGAEISSGTHGAGTGGDVTITAGSVTLDGSDGRRTRIATDTDGLGGATVADLAVQLNIEHTYDGDLVISLISPGGREVTLANHVGGSGDNFLNTIFSPSATTSISSGSAPFAGTFSPSDDLRLFNGENINGPWTLRIRDTAGRDEGQLTRWGLGSNFPQFFSTDVPKSILDNSTVLSALNVNVSPGAGTFGSGGTINLSAGSVRLTGTAEISGQSQNPATGGSITVKASGPIILRDGAQIVTKAPLGDGGAITVSSGVSLRFDNSQVSAQALGRGGKIVLMAPRSIHLQDSQVFTRGFTGGNIEIDPETVSLNRSVVDARTSSSMPGGADGKVTIRTEGLITSADSVVTATGGVEIFQGSELNTATLFLLSGSLLGAESRLPERCAVRLPGDFSSFISVGRGGLPLEPADFQPSFLLIEETPRKKRP